MKRGTLEKLRLGAVVEAWRKRDHMEPPALVTSSRCDACLHIQAVVWEKAHKRICFGCASMAIKQAAREDADNTVHPLHVLLDDWQFMKWRERKQ